MMDLSHVSLHDAHTDWAQYSGPVWAVCQMTPSKWTELRRQMWQSSQSLAFGTARILGRMCFIASFLILRCRRQLSGPSSEVHANIFFFFFFGGRRKTEGCQAWRITWQEYTWALLQNNNQSYRCRVFTRAELVKCFTADSEKLN